MLKSQLAIAALAAVSTTAILQTPAPASPAAGEWQTDYGAVSLTQSGNGPGVTGSYENGASEIEGRMADGVLEGFWFEPRSGQRCDRAMNGTYYWGKLRFDFSSDFTRFEGLWSYCDQPVSRAWDGDLGNLLGFGSSGSANGNGYLALPGLGSCSALENNIFSPVGEGGRRFNLVFRPADGQFASVAYNADLIDVSNGGRGPIESFEQTMSMGRGASYLRIKDAQSASEQEASFPLYFFDASLRETSPEASKYMVVGNLGYHDYYNHAGSRDREGHPGDVMWERRCR